MIHPQSLCINRQIKDLYISLHMVLLEKVKKFEEAQTRTRKRKSLHCQSRSLPPKGTVSAVSFFTRDDDTRQLTYISTNLTRQLVIT